MSVTKVFPITILISGVCFGSARGDAIWSNGLFAGVPAGGVVTSAPSAPSHNLAPAPAPAPLATSPAISYVSPAPQALASPAYDAFVNFSSGSFANSGSLTTGNPQAWYDSSKILGLFGGQPTAQQVSSFDATVLQRVEQTFRLSGVPVSLTDDPSSSAAHTLSVVSNTVNPNMGNVIGMTNIGGNGFHYIDNSATYARSVDQLEWIVAHNVAHELMLAFGVPEVHDQSGHYIDSTVAPISTFLNPNATFSTGAVQDLLSKNFKQYGGSMYSTQAQLIGTASVPEPTTLLAWTFGALALVAAQRVRSRRAGN